MKNKWMAHLFPVAFLGCGAGLTYMMKKIPDIGYLAAAAKSNFKKLAWMFVFLAVISGVTLFLRGPQVSNYLKKLLFTQFESATGYRMTADKLYANLIPLYVGADNLRVFDENGETVFSAAKVKAYAALVPLLQKTVLIKRIALVRPSLWVTDSRVDHIESLAKGKKPLGGFRLKVGSVVLEDAALNYSGRAGGLSIACQGVNGEVFPAPRQEVRVFSARDIRLSGNGIPRLDLKLDGAMASFKKGVLGIRDITVESGGSKMRLEGSYSKAEGVQAKTRLGLLMSTVKEIFHLDVPEKGKLSITGQARLESRFLAGKFSDWKKTDIDMKVQGGLYAQSLLKLLGAGVKVAGFIKVNGRVKGPLDSLDGSGSGSLDKADIYGVSADSLDFGVGFHHGVLSFNKIAGRLYGGRAKGDFSISLPKVSSLDMDVDFSGLDSKSFMTGFLKTSLPLPDGRLSGRMFNRGAIFAPAGNFRFLAGRAGRGFPGRIGSMASGFNISGNAVNFSNMVIRTSATEITGSGNINYARSTTDMALSLRTSDFRDLTLPYSHIAEGSGGFDGRIYGPLKDPEIEGRIFSGNAVFDGMRVGATEGDVSYNKNSLVVHSLRAKAGGETVNVQGSMLFPEAKEIFELQNPVYDLDVKLAGGRAQDIVENFIKPGIRLTGIIQAASLKIKGKSQEISGSVKAGDVVYSGASVTSADFDFDYDAGSLSISRGTFAKNGAVMKLTGSLKPDGAFNFKASSSGVDIRDLFTRAKDLPVDYKVSFDAAGKGTFKDPGITVKGTLSGGKFHGRPIGGGAFSVDVSPGTGGGTASVHLALQGGKMDLKGQAILKGEVPWQAQVVLKNGAYDFLAAPMFKTVPPDLMVTLQGKGHFSGNLKGGWAKAISGSLALNELAFTAFGQSFSTREPARFNLRDKTLSVSQFSLVGGRTDVGVSGSVVLGRNFDLSIEGKSSLAPLKGLSKQIDLLTGGGNYVLHIGGNWNSPKISGGLSLSNVALGIRGVPQNLRIISAYMYVDENKIVLEQLAAKTGGGDANMSGVIYLEKLHPARFYLDGVVNNVSVSVKGFDATVDGNIAASGDKSGQTISGEIFVKRASYSKNVDWKAFILRKRAALPPSPKSFQATTGLNIRIYGSRQIMVKNNLVRAPLSADLTIRGTLANPIPLGRVETASGKVYFRNTEFTIEHASVIFSDPNRIDPSMDVTASTTIRGYEINISMAGALDHMTLAFSSQPYLEQMDILSLLTTGNLSGSSSPGIEGGVGASEASSFITGQFEDVITKRLKSITGFDRFQIEPYVSSTGTVTPRITVSKRLLGDRLFVIYSAPIGTEDQIMRLEYAVTPSVSLIGSRDDTGDIGGDIKYQFRFR